VEVIAVALRQARANRQSILDRCRSAGKSYSCFMCSSASLLSSGPMFFRNMARLSELMMAVLLG